MAPRDLGHHLVRERHDDLSEESHWGGDQQVEGTRGDGRRLFADVDGGVPTSMETKSDSGELPASSATADIAALRNVSIAGWKARKSHDEQCAPRTRPAPRRAPDDEERGPAETGQEEVVHLHTHLSVFEA